MGGWAMARAVTAILLFLLMLNNSALGCLWIRGTSQEGEVVKRMGRDATDELNRALKVNIREKGQKLLAKHRNGSTLDDRNNYAVGLVYLGRAEEAIQLLNALEKEKPGEYATAANLGTAYELAGKNEEALHWIQEGIRRDPMSHRGSEWVHVAILQAKLAFQKDPGYLETQGVIPLEALLSQKPDDIFRTSDRAGKIREEVLDDIVYQLRERLQFVRSKDPVVAQLLFELGRLQEVSVTLEMANRIFRMAEDFGYPSTKIQPMIEENEVLIRRAYPGIRRDLPNAFGWQKLFVLLCVCLVVGLGVWAPTLWRKFVRRPR
jgi:tetratricopeptide (TPR) repeat protein